MLPREETTMAEQKPYLAPLQGRPTLVLDPADNGGWVVSERTQTMGLNGRVIGAFTTTRDMLAALQALDAEPAAEH